MHWMEVRHNSWTAGKRSTTSRWASANCIVTHRRKQKTWPFCKSQHKLGSVRVERNVWFQQNEQCAAFLGPSWCLEMLFYFCFKYQQNCCSVWCNFRIISPFLDWALALLSCALLWYSFVWMPEMQRPMSMTSAQNLPGVDDPALPAFFVATPSCRDATLVLHSYYCYWSGTFTTIHPPTLKMLTRKYIIPYLYFLILGRYRIWKTLLSIYTLNPFQSSDQLAYCFSKKLFLLLFNKLL